MCEKLIYLTIMLLCVTSSVQAVESFSILPTDDAIVGNDEQCGPDTNWADDVGVHARDIGVRKRVTFISFDISEIGAQLFQNVVLNNYGWQGTGQIVNVYGILESYDVIDENTITWNTAPGVQHDVEFSAPVLDTIDYNDLTDLLVSFAAPAQNVRETTEPNQAMDDFVNSDIDGIVTFMYVPAEPDVSVILLGKEAPDSPEGFLGGGTYLEGDFIPALYAYRPNPTNGQTDVRRDVVLSWRPGIKVDKHDVYFGTDVNDVNEATRDNPLDVLVSQGQEGTTYDPDGLLDYGQTYYWRIDEVNDAEPESPWIGNVWSFTVGNFIVVDDFEIYDAGENQIWFIWKDGYGYGVPGTPDYYPGNGTGSAVGDEDSPTYMEMNIVHSGQQSCPFAYNNIAAPMYSEILREWEAAQDWTVDDVVTLTLWFRGDEGNSAEPLYVAVEDSAGKSKIVTHPDPAAVLLFGWQQWDIPLSELSAAGVNLAAVKKMIIGVGNKAAPQMGSTGALFFDDIRLYRP